MFADQGDAVLEQFGCVRCGGGRAGDDQSAQVVDVAFPLSPEHATPRARRICGGRAERDSEQLEHRRGIAPTAKLALDLIGHPAIDPLIAAGA